MLDKWKYKERKDLKLENSLRSGTRESCLRKFGHVQRRTINAPMRKSELIQVERMERGRGRQIIALIEVFKKISIREITKSITSDRIER